MLISVALLSGALIGGASVYIYNKFIKESNPEDGVEYINPPELSKPVGYSHITTALLTEGCKIVCIAGQASLDKDQENVVIGVGDISAQAHNAYSNLGKALKAAGARPQDVLRSNIYTTASSPEDISKIVEAREAFFNNCKSAPPGALLGVPFLALNGLGVEVDCEAIVPNSRLKFN